MKKIMKWTAIVIGGLFVLISLVGWILYSTGVQKLDQSYLNLAVETVKIPIDADAVARGKHVATIWACTRCHGEDLSGRLITKDPLSGLVPLLGTIPAPNLTTGKGGVAAFYTDTDWVRAIRHGVMPDGRFEALMFDYSTLSDQDLGDLIAYLKQIPPVDTNHPAIRYGPIIPILSNIGLFMPAPERRTAETPHPADPAPSATAEYGRYLSAVCSACHGNFIGNEVKSWKQDQFIHTFQSGVLPDGKSFGPTMSSNTFREMNDTELNAMWLYFTNPSQ